MTDFDLKNFLFKLSVQALHRLSNGSEDPITIQEAIERNSILKPILYCFQIMDVNFLREGSKSVIFMLSPQYLLENELLARQGALNELSWTFTLPPYDYDEDEGVVEWMMKSLVEVSSKNARIDSIDLEQFQKSVIATEAD